MILREVRARHFAGLGQRELALRPGLNVVVGPNEAGKSSFFRAIDCALFTPSKIPARQLEGEMGRYFPASGGNTIGVELLFSRLDDDYLLSKTWGAQPGVSLRLPGGGQLGGDKEVDARLQDLLPAPPGTCRAVLLTLQAGLGTTLGQLRQNREALATIDDLLRSAIEQTGGVSVERFRQKLQERSERTFARWDRARRCPEEPGRRFQRGRGSILEAHDAWQDAKRELQEQMVAESQLDTLNGQIAEITRAVAQNERYLSANRQAVEDARQRAVLEAQQQNCKRSCDQLAATYERWIRLETLLPELERQLQQADMTLARLATERAEAQREAQHRQVRERFARAQAARRTAETAQEALSSVTPITAEQLEQIRSAQEELDRIRAVVSEGRLRLVMQSRNGLALRVTSDSGRPAPCTVAAGVAQVLEAQARLVVEHEDWTINVTSGKGDVDARLGDLDAATKKVDALWTLYAVSSLEQARQWHRAWTDKKNAADQAQRDLARVLEDTTWQDLEQRMEAAGPAQQTRSEADIAAQAGQVEAECQTRKNYLAEVRNELADLAERYRNKIDLMSRIATEAGRCRDLEQKLDALVPLPPEANDANTFITDYETHSAGLEKQREALGKMRVEKAALDERLAEKPTAEELEQKASEAQRLFQDELKKGDALARVQAVFDEVQACGDETVYAGLKAELERMLSTLTAGRYTQVVLDKGLPGQLHRTDQVWLTLERLSLGTTDALALAVRLAMASQVLAGHEGFLLLDDPLVDLDPERQEAAALLVKTFANDKQVVVFTCHPRHAEILGGHRVDLS